MKKLLVFVLFYFFSAASMADSNSDMINAVNKFDSLGTPDPQALKKLRKQLRRLGWQGGLTKFRQCIERDSVPH